ncbi:MAG: MFS transporter [Candidatus Velthaea sp.]
MGLLAVAHVANDINQSFIPAILPFLILKLHLTYTAAASLVLAQAISSSIIQPVIGHLADKRALPWFIACGMLLAGLGVAAMGVAPTYALVFAASLASGVGVAMFHPEAARFANYVAGEKKATGMRWFAVGGNVGFALGPVFATAAVSVWGLQGTLAAAFPVMVLAAIVFREIPRLLTFLPSARRAGSLPEFGDDWASFWKLTVFVVVRSTAYIGLVTFIPLYAVGALHASAALGAAMLTTYLVCGILGTIAGGPLADRFGRRAVLLASMCGATLLVTIFVAVTHSGTVPLALAFVLAGAIGFVLVASQTSFIVLGQEYLPNRLGIATGVTMGLAVSLGGTFAPVLGALADARGITAPIVGVAVLCAAAVLAGWTLPAHARRLPYVKSGKPSVASAS